MTKKQLNKLLTERIEQMCDTYFDLNDTNSDDEW